MKFEKFILTSVVVLGVIIICLGIVTSNHFYRDNANTVPTFATLTSYKDQIITYKNTSEVIIFSKSNSTSQTNTDFLSSATSEIWDLLTKNSITQFFKNFAIIGNAITALNEILNYVYADPNVILLLGIFIVISLSFAAVKFFTGRKP